MHGSSRGQLIFHIFQKLVASGFYVTGTVMVLLSLPQWFIDGKVAVGALGLGVILFAAGYAISRNSSV